MKRQIKTHIFEKLDYLPVLSSASLLKTGRSSSSSLPDSSASKSKKSHLAIWACFRVRLRGLDVVFSFFTEGACSCLISRLSYSESLISSFTSSLLTRDRELVSVLIFYWELDLLILRRNSAAVTFVSLSAQNKRLKINQVSLRFWHLPTISTLVEEDCLLET